MKIYLDHSATTYTDKKVLEEMLPFFNEAYGNGSSQHGYGREALKAIDKAREIIAKCINAKSSEIYFTSGGTESDNWAIKGTAHGLKEKGNKIITSKIEHPAVMQSLKTLEKEGFEVVYLNVSKEGFISLDELEAAIDDKTILITIMTANNEMGAIQPIEKIGEIARKHKVYFHTDAVQAAGNMQIDVEKMHIDMLSMSAHKFYGPKGVGILYKRNGLKVKRFMDGGEQERNLRAGTLNTPGVVGAAKALELACQDMDNNNKHIQSVRDYFVEKVKAQIPDILYNGPKDVTKRLPGNASFSFIYVEGESILMLMDMEGIAISSGSACSSGSLEPSYVMLSIGVPIEIAHGTIRFSFGKGNTKEEADYVIEKLVAIIKKLRELSPLFKGMEGDFKYDV